MFRFVMLMMLWVPPAASAAPSILVYGDSLSAAYGIANDQGWAVLLQKKLTALGYPHRVANASISGETTSGGRSRIAATLKQQQPAIVILALGANDGLRGLPVKDMQANLAAIIAACRAQRARVLLVGMRIPPNYGPRYTEAFAAAYPELSRQFKLPLVPFLLDGVGGDRALTQEDGLHPTAAAQPRLLENLWSELQPLLGMPVKTKSRQAAS